MSVPFAAVVTPDSLVFTAPDGKTHTITSDQPEFKAAKMSIKTIQSEIRDVGESDDTDELRQLLVDLISPSRKLNEGGHGLVTVRDGVVFYADNAIHSALTERILWGLGEGFVMEPYLAFLANLMENPSKRSVDQLYTLIETHKLGITDDGHILGYKRVRDDFSDIYSGLFDNFPGEIVEMPRNQVNDDPSATCSAGLHFCSQSYLPHYGVGPGYITIIVKVNPRDVVSVPEDYDAAKVRCCRYEVLAEYKGNDKDDLLSTKPVFNDVEFDDDDDDDDDFPGNADDDQSGWDAGTDVTSISIGDTVICVEDYPFDEDGPKEGQTFVVTDADDDSHITVDGYSYRMSTAYFELHNDDDGEQELVGGCLCGNQEVDAENNNSEEVNNARDESVAEPPIISTGNLDFPVDRSLTDGWDISRLPN